MYVDKEGYFVCGLCFVCVCEEKIRMGIWYIGIVVRGEVLVK